MADVLILPAPAKVNLFLHITGRRADGYHTLESAMVYVAFGDTITLTRRDDAQIALRTPLAGVAPEDDLCVRAASLLQKTLRVNTGVTIDVIKRIPTGAGLGGGSSDAATVLLGLNRLWNADCSRAALQRMALSLGADVPFFIFGQAALARGIGEQLTPISVPSVAITLVKPNVHVPTPQIFAHASLTRNTAPLQFDVLPLHAGRNDMQATAEALYPEVAIARHALGSHARMSGSGASVFTLKSPALPPAVWGIRTHLLARHPLHSFTGP
jgi:4-diphosphocytidyl-2-C-methyl-D-erythritol kinase